MYDFAYIYTFFFLVFTTSEEKLSNITINCDSMCESNESGLLLSPKNNATTAEKLSFLKNHPIHPSGDLKNYHLISILYIIEKCLIYK